MIIQLSVPAYAPNRRPDYIERIFDAPALVPVDDVRLGYTDGGALGLRFNPSEPGGLITELLGRGVANVCQSGVSNNCGDYLFAQRMTLNFVLCDGSVHYLWGCREPVSVTGRSNLTIFTPEGKTTFNGQIVGTARVVDDLFDNAVELSLRFVGSTSNHVFISLDIHGDLIKAEVSAQRIDFEWDLGDGFAATGTILTIETSPSR